MGINRAEQSINNRLVREVANNARDLRQLKSSIQPIGADILNVIRVPSGGYLFGGPVTLAAGEMVTFITTAVPSSDILTIWNFLHSIYVDSAVVDSAYNWPNGSSITSDMRKVECMAWIDWGTSSDDFNARTYKVHVINNGSSSHTVAIAVRAYLPSLSGVTSE